MKTRILLLACLVLSACSKQEEPETRPVVDVKVARAELRDVQISVSAPATIFPREQANIASRITAPIKSLSARKGDRVNSGQILARLENRDLLAQRTEALTRARADLASAQAALTQAQKNLERRQKLFDQGAIPNRELLASQTEFAQAKASYDAARKTLDLLESTGGHGSGTDGANEASINALIQFTEIRSPFAGVITEQFMYPGDLAKPENPIFTLMDLSTAVARAQVPESDVAGVAAGESCRFEGVDQPGKPREGRVTVVNRAVDPARRSVEVWCEIPNANGALRGGAFGQLAISIRVDRGSVVVPREAVLFEEGTKKGSVLVVGEDHLARKKDVEAGQLFDDKVQIKSGLKPGETVIVEAGYGLPDGTAVRLPGEKKDDEKKETKKPEEKKT